MKYFRFYLTCLALSVCAVLRAQSLSVESFRLLENDLTANTYGTMEYDQNGQVSALIKVQTLEKGFVFDGGMLGIVKVDQKAGEMWVYVPYGLQRITIAHPDFGVLRDYYFPIPIEKARTYELKLIATRPEPTPEKVSETKREEPSLNTMVNVSFDNEMSTSDIYINGMKLATGSWKGLLTATSYLVEVKQRGYNSYTTTITLRPDAPTQRIKIPALEPYTGTISVSCNPKDADVYIDGYFAGTSPLKKEGVPVGEHSVELRMKGYSSYKTSVSITEEKRMRVVEISLTEKRYLTKNNIYAGGSLQMGHASGSVIQAGIFWGMVNAELGYYMPNESSQKIYWVTSPDNWSGSMSRKEYDYSVSSAIRGGIGIGFRYGNHWRFTPQAGMIAYTIDGVEVGKSGNKGNQTTYVASGLASVKVEYSFMRHVGITLTPSYEKPVKMGELATAIDKNTDYIKNWCSGFSVMAGLEIYF